VKSRLILSAGVIVLALAGCTATTTTHAAPQTTHSAASTAAPKPSATSTPRAPDSIADDPADYVLGDPTTYAWITPSRNTACGIESVDYNNSLDHTMWGCEVNHHTWVTPAKSPGDFCYNAQIPCGTGVVAIDALTPTPSEHGDERYPSEEAMFGNTSAIALATKTLAYGHSITVGTITCTSVVTGMTCRNTDGGHGFAVSKSTYLTH
jgi:hypothetical protein